MLPGAEPALDEKDLVTINRFATWVGGDATSIKTRVVAAGYSAVVERQGHKFYRVADLFRAFSRENEFQRRARVQADEIELRIAVSKGDLIKRPDHVAALAAMAKLMREALDTIPDIVERDSGAPPQVVARIEQILDGAAVTIAERMAGLAAEHAASAEPPPEEPKPSTTEPRQREAAAQRAPIGGALELACMFLRELLAGGPRLATDIIQDAATRQMSETSLRRAKSKLGIVARRAGKGWEWALPDQGSQDGQQS